MKNVLKKISLFAAAVMIMMALAVPAFAASDDTAEAATTLTATATSGLSDTACKAFAAAIVVGIGAACGAVSMGIAISKSSEAIARQPEAAGDIRSGMMLGLVFIETAIIYALIVAILIVFVL